MIAAFAVNAIFFGDEAAADVVLQPIGADRDDPFTQPVAPQPAGSLLDYASSESGEVSGATTQTAGYRTPDGSVPGIYGGSLNESSCDPDLLQEFLVAEQERAAAWAAVLEISIDDIPAYLDGLTPVNLAADTRVRNHGFQDGEAVPRQAILQRGSAVLIDRRGVPRVDCYSGSPLREPEALDDESFTGEEWETFQRERVIVVSQAPTDVDSFELEDVETGDIFARPAGSRGDADRPGTIDLVDDGPIDFDTEYEDSLIEGRGQARYFVDAPDGAIMTVRVENRRDSESTVDVSVESRGSTFASTNRISQGATWEETIVLDHQGGGEFEVIFSRGPAAYDFEVELDVQRDAGQEGDAGDAFDTGRQIASGDQVEGLLGGQDTTDVFLLDVVPGAELRLRAENLRGSSGNLDITVRLADSTLFSTSRLGAAGTYEEGILLSGEDSGVVEVIMSRGASNYVFTAEMVEQQDAGEPGDAGNARGDTREIATGVELSGQVGNRDPADWYVFEAPGPGVEVVVRNDIDSPGSLDATIEDDSASTQASTTRMSAGTEETLVFEAEPGEEYWLYFERGRSDYSFEIREVTLDN